MNYSVRRLGANDVGLMRSLNRVFGEVFEDEASYGGEAPSDEYLAGWLGVEKNVVLVAMAGYEVIGGLVAYVLRKFEQERSEVYLYDLAVAKAHHRKGVGTGLVRKLQEVAGELGAYVVFVQADEGDEAVEFYRALGPTEDLQTRNFDFPVRR
jgi:aminoglycoside 3-N-acetyltransferase I